MNTGAAAVAWTSGLDVGTAFVRWNTCFVMMPKGLLGRLQGFGRVRWPIEEPLPGVCPLAAHLGREASGMTCSRGGAPGGGAGPWRPQSQVEGVVQRFPGQLRGVGDAGSESQVVPAAWWGRYLVGGGVHSRLRDLSVVVPLYCQPGVLVFEDLYYRCGRGVRPLRYSRRAGRGRPPGGLSGALP